MTGRNGTEKERGSKGKGKQINTKGVKKIETYRSEVDRKSASRVLQEWQLQWYSKKTV